MSPRTFSPIQSLVQFRSKAVVSPLALSAWTILFLFATANRTFWTIGLEVFPGHDLEFGKLLLAVFLLTLGAFSLFAIPWIVKPFLAFVTLLSAVTSYYVDSLGVIVDRDMIQNAMVTTINESRHLITPNFVTHVFIFGIIPAAIILSIRLKPQRWLRVFVTPVISFALSVGIAVGLLASDLKSFSAIFRERKDLMNSYQPGAPLVGMIRYARMVSGVKDVTVAPIGEDAEKGTSYRNGAKPVLAVVVAGETARSQNFSLNGYEVETNPRLAGLPVVSFSNVQSCGTATAVSLPCMFSKYGREEYSYERGVSTENLLDVLSHAGFHVEWWDNNTGHKGIANRVEAKSFVDRTNPDFCGLGECVDGIFLKDLKDYAGSISEDTVLVVHQIGSHGPSYFLRYPEGFEKFGPACRTTEFMDCSAEEIVNAYDNTIAYTDDFLADAIGVLGAQDRADTALIYVSDHGESLGEDGMYLHGAPYFMAPDVQTTVPMIFWLSDQFKERFSMDSACLSAKKEAEFSHDNLFHSLLGMLDIATGEHDAGLDLFASCMNRERMASR